MKYIDIHCHLDFPDYGEEIADVLVRMKEGEVSAITIGTDLVSSKRVVEIAEANENVWACIGVHPEETTSPRPDINQSDPLLSAGEGKSLSLGKEQLTEGGWDEVEFEKLIQNPKVVSVGECGLDFFRIKPEDLESEKERQTKLFKSQIEFALKYDKPLMLHCREAYDEVLVILADYKKEAGDKLKGNVHFFAGKVAQAQKFLDLGFTMSFTGVITFPPRLGETGTHNYDEVIKFLPIESIMSETDAPFVAPTPYRGRRNEPVFVLEVIKRLAELKEVSFEKMAEQIKQNAERLFDLKNH
jgi:TatD DNase family protein